ncbi:MAG: hypothetical protein KF851_18315 [Pirellulaceae bacterium]|nr:hypothetical protein [Pirellulaceae bacterium]
MLQNTTIRAWMMLAWGIFWTCSIAGEFVSGQTTGGTHSFPYTAYALHDGVRVHSGPGPDHYATQALPKGTLVEVHRHDPDDWCAIRPTDEAFSMVPAEMIEVLSEREGRCLSDGVQVWVGTELDPVDRPLWQVKLKAGEKVELLGEVSYPTAEGFSTAWYQIAPPPGEFRWVKRTELLLPDPKTNQIGGNTRSPTLATPQEQNAERPNPVRLAQATDVLDNPFPDDPELLSGSSPRIAARSNLDDNRTDSDNSGWRRARVPLRIAQADTGGTSLNQRDANSDWARGTGGDMRTSGGSDLTRSSLASSYSDVPEDVVNARLTPTFGTESITDRLQRLDLELASEIIKPAESWQLNSFADRLVRIQESAETPAEAQQARRLIEKVDRLRSTQSRLIETNVGSRRSNLINRSAAVGSGVESEVQFGTTYDAYGWLSQLTRKSGKAEPGYVLQDDQGKILCLIEPSPGLNLHRYLNTKVGVVGTRGYNQQLKVNHITADRVVVLENNQTKRR